MDSVPPKTQRRIHVKVTLQEVQGKEGGKKGLSKSGICGARASMLPQMAVRKEVSLGYIDPEALGVLPGSLPTKRRKCSHWK